jgi:tetratricopeptide (TPR) repeat protein
MQVLGKRAALTAALCLAVLPAISSQSGATDLDDWYRYPLSLGAQYQSITPLGESTKDYELYDLSALLRWPLPGLPVLQPTLRAGLLQWNPASDEAAWKHRDLYGLLGAAWSSRISKSFEFGADAAIGASLSLYPDLVPGGGTVGNPNLLAQAGGRLALIPSFNFSLELTPSLTLIRSVGALADFDGLVLGIGLAAHVRLGEDPDAPKAALRSIRWSQAGPTSVFPAMQSWYARNPITRLSLTNVESFPIENVEVSFFQKGYMDSPTLCASIPSIAPGESREVGILASYNAEVFRNEGVTPLSGEVTVTYAGRGRPGEQRATLAYDLQDKSAITWDDDRKAAAFITPADSALRNYASYIRQINKAEVQPGYSEAVQFANQLFHALGEIGILYQADPTQPFTAVQGKSMSVDSVSLPRQTLSRITGDCDDLSVLYASLLESAGIATALVTVPGHIYVAFGTKTAGKAWAELSPDRNQLINVEDELWVPVEVTMIGQASFIEAWRKGVEEWRAWESEPARRGFFPTKKAQETYRPVGLRETDLGLQYGRKDVPAQAAARDTAKLIDALADAATAAAKAAGSKEEWNRLGIRLARYGRSEKAIEAFRQASRLDPKYQSPRMNLGNVYFLGKAWDKALAEYLALEKSLQGTEGIAASLRLNISKCYSAKGDFAKAASYLELASRLDPSLAEKYAYLAQAGAADGSGGRASEAASPGDDIIFWE